MTFEDYLENLERIQNRLLTMPEEEALGTSFSKEQENLSQLIPLLKNYSPEQQEQAKELMRKFADRLNEKLDQLKLRMEHLSESMDQQQVRMRGMKAYNQGKIF